MDPIQVDLKKWKKDGISMRSTNMSAHDCGSNVFENMTSNHNFPTRTCHLFCQPSGISRLNLLSLLNNQKCQVCPSQLISADFESIASEYRWKHKLLADDCK